MRACKSELRTGAANFATSIYVGSISITNSVTTQSQPCVLHLPEHECVVQRLWWVDLAQSYDHRSMARFNIGEYFYESCCL